MGGHLVPIYVSLYIYTYTVIHISSIYNRSIHMVLTFITHRIKLGCNPKWVNLPETLTENSEVNVFIPQLLKLKNCRLNPWGKQWCRASGPVAYSFGHPLCDSQPQITKTTCSITMSKQSMSETVKKVCTWCHAGPMFGCTYTLVNKHNYGKSPFLMGKSTINGHVQ